MLIILSDAQSYDALNVFIIVLFDFAWDVNILFCLDLKSDILFPEYNIKDTPAL